MAKLARSPSSKRVGAVLAVLVFAALYLSIDLPLLRFVHRHHVRVPLHAADTLAKCRSLSLKPAPPPGFSSRTQSDRYEPGTPPVLVRNASIWTGLDDGAAIVRGDILLRNGLIESVGGSSAFESSNDVIIVDAQGAWVTPGVVDVHSHIGVMSSPAFQGTKDADSHKGLALPWLRSLDGLNTHDDAYAHAIAGGVTTSLILPGSANAIGGQAFAIKLRSTSERTPSSLLVDPPYGLDGAQIDYTIPPRWRHMKQACGAYSYQLKRLLLQERIPREHIQDREWIPYGHFVKLDSYEHASRIKRKQDEYCSKAFADRWEGLSEFPEDLQWEALVDVLRGKVKVQTHCYEAVDIEAFVRLSNEFQFPIAAFHHAHDAYLVPAVLKRAYDHPPAVAMFAAFARYKREAYRHSEFAPRILNEHGIKVVMKSDHPGIQSRWLLHEAQQAHYYGLPANVALASVTTNAAELLGLEHRLGYIKEGSCYDADLVIWDSHPLALGAMPLQVFIDGIPQLHESANKKGEERQTTPITPSFDEEANTAVKFAGLPPMEAASVISGSVMFQNVSSMWRRDESGVHPIFQAHTGDDEGVVFVEHGEIVCAGTMGSCDSFLDGRRMKVIDLGGGSVTPALVSVGTSLGLQEIAFEASTSDGPVFDPLQVSIPSVLGENSIIRAVDGLVFGTRDAQLAYRSGVTTAIASPISNGFLAGLGTYFSLGAQHKLEEEAVLDDVTAVHVAVLHRDGGPSVSIHIAALRRLLLGPYTGERGASFEAVVKGKLPLVVNVQNADIVASLLKLKKEVEAISGAPMKMTILGASEAHLVAAELAAANVGVIVTPPRSFSFTWEGRRTFQGPHATGNGLTISLFAHGVTVGIGHQGFPENPQMSGWAARNMRWDAAWVHVDSDGLIGMEDALDMATTNVEKLLGVTRKASECDMVATKGGELLGFEGKVVAVASPRRGVVDLFE